jgi:hypothetical protein
MQQYSQLELKILPDPSESMTEQIRCEEHAHYLLSLLRVGVFEFIPTGWTVKIST